MITIKKSTVADTRSCDFTKVSKDELYEASRQHIGDVRDALWFFMELLKKAGQVHDQDKLTDINSFHEDFIGGFKSTAWWDRHRKLNRHHLMAPDGVPEDVNLVDVLDFISDCVMAGKARTGEVYPLEIPPEVLMRAFKNTVELLTANVQVIG